MNIRWWSSAYAKYGSMSPPIKVTSSIMKSDLSQILDTNWAETVKSGLIQSSYGVGLRSLDTESGSVARYMYTS